MEMRTISQWVEHIGSDRDTTSAPPARALSDMELDQVAAAGGSKGGGLGRGGGGAVWPPPRGLN
jgi:hypothetical protein